MLGWSVILIMIAYETNQYSMLILSQATEIVKGADPEIKAATTQLPYLSQLQKKAKKISSRGMNDICSTGDIKAKLSKQKCLLCYMKQKKLPNMAVNLEVL